MPAPASSATCFTKSRVEEVSGRPLLYTLTGLYSGVNDVIHDLAWHEWLIDTNRLLKSKSIDAAIRNHYGPEVKGQLKTWAADIAEGEKGTADAVDAMLGYVRQSVSVAGLGFKLGAAPFHMWVPDVYQGAPTPVTLLIGGAPKFAAFAITIRLLVEGMLGLALEWQPMFVVLAVASLAVGNLAAIAQTNLKRMLAYSTISQMGFVLLGLLSGVINGQVNSAVAENAYSASMFYVVTYVLTTLATFGVILLLAREGFESEEISDLAGLNQRSPLYAGVMAICLFSMAGIPPLVGFYAKLAVLQSLLASGQTAYIALAVFAVVMSLIGAFYYLRVVKVMYFDAPLTATSVSAPLDVRFVLTLNGALVLVLGLLPGGLMALCADAIVRALAT